MKKMTELYIKINKNVNKTSPKQSRAEHWPKARKNCAENSGEDFCTETVMNTAYCLVQILEAVIASLITSKLWILMLNCL